MNVKTQILVIIIVIIGLVALINMIRKNKVDLRYSLLWFVLGVGVLVFACVPSLTEKLARLFGVGLPINLLFFVGFCFSLVIIFSLSVAVSKLAEKVKKLTQEVGILKEKLEK